MYMSTKNIQGALPSFVSVSETPKQRDKRLDAQIEKARTIFRRILREEQGSGVGSMPKARSEIRELIKFDGKIVPEINAWNEKLEKQIKPEIKENKSDEKKEAKSNKKPEEKFTVTTDQIMADLMGLGLIPKKK